MHPPRGICAECWSDRIVHEPVSGRATVHSFVVLPETRRAPPAEGPKITVWAELAEQEKMFLVADMVEGSPKPAIGDAVQLAWAEFGGVPVPAFEKAT
jgi:uncharacterized OB-fold protein